MAKLLWDTRKKRYFETGVSHGILFPYVNGSYSAGVAWNGLTKVSETSSGGDENAIYADNGKYVALMGTDEFEFTIEAYQCPKEFLECTGVNDFNGMCFGQQRRRKFGFSYTTLVGNDEDGLEHGEKIHLVYGAATKSSDKDYETINDSPDAMTMSWECTTTPITVSGFKPTAHLVLDSRKIDSQHFADIKTLIYGGGYYNWSPQLLLPDTILKRLGINADLVVLDTAIHEQIPMPGYLGSRVYDVSEGQSGIKIHETQRITGMISNEGVRDMSGNVLDEWWLVVAVDMTVPKSWPAPRITGVVAWTDWNETHTTGADSATYIELSAGVSDNNEESLTRHSYTVIGAPLTSIVNSIGMGQYYDFDSRFAAKDPRLRIVIQAKGETVWDRTYDLSGLTFGDIVYLEG